MLFEGAPSSGHGIPRNASMRVPVRAGITGLNNPEYNDAALCPDTIKQNKYAQLKFSTRRLVCSIFYILIPGHKKHREYLHENALSLHPRPTGGAQRKVSKTERQQHTEAAIAIVSLGGWTEKSIVA